MVKRIQVILADDHALVLDGLKLHLADTSDIEVVATVNNGEALLSAIEIHRPDVVITDLMMAGMDGFAVLEQIRQRNLPVRVLVLTALADGQALQRVVELEADGIVLKTEPSRQMIEAIRQVAGGQVVYPRAVHNWLLRRASRHQAAIDTDPTHTLSDREKEVLAHIAQGKTNQEIASTLHLSENTVKYYLKNVYQKLQVHNRTEAARIYLQGKETES
ncbi:MAG: response regulator transcription factor [Anaerolineaceae bacterium]|nr:response regulator transcription factor [Anaerolineaceae bacterium]MCB9101275.1 response regulator transcription factor [Anaerolineales bacterium]